MFESLQAFAFSLHGIIAGFARQDHFLSGVEITRRVCVYLVIFDGQPDIMYTLSL